MATRFTVEVRPDLPNKRPLPAGTVTFLFTDIDGSTRLLHELGAERYAQALANHRRVLREAFERHGGVEVDTQGDAFFVAFPTAPGALRAAAHATRALDGGPVAVRIGVHTGTPLVGDEGYVGADVHRAARIAAAAHGGQVVVSAAAAALTDNLPLRDLGEHRFKDLAAPERVFQLGEGDFPPLRSLYRTNLPVPATSFVGREREVVALTELLAAPSVRLLTLTGPGGTGKTRLALQAVAEAAERFPDGLTWLALAPLDNAALIPAALADALGLGDQVHGGAMDDLARALAGREGALVLDNAEHLLPQAADELAPLLEVPGPTLVVTSRQRLDLPGERVFPVEPLAGEEAVALFEERAGALGVQPAARDALAALCSRLDNLPLAVELAAARAPLFAPEQLLERLGQRLDLLKGGRRADPRQQTLRATIEWSHDLLDEDERVLFRRLAVFVGGCTYEAAEEVCEADPDVVQSLLEKSLLRRRDGAFGPRLWLLETIRQFAGEQLDAAGERARLEDGHARWFGAWAPPLARRLRAYDPDALSAIADELANVRAALAHTLERQDVVRAGSLLFGAFFYWLTHGHGRESVAAVARWLELGRDAVEPIERVPGLLAAGELLRFAGDLRRAAELKEELLGIVRAHQPGAEVYGWPLASVLPSLLTDLSTMEADWDIDAAARHADEALGLRRRAGEPGGIAHALVGVASVAFVRRDFERSRAALAEAVELWRRAGSEPEIPGALATIAEYLLHLGRLDEARDLLAEALEGTRAGSDHPQLLYTLRVVGLHAALSDRAQLAGMLFGATDRAGQETVVRLRSERETELEQELLARAGAVGPAWPHDVARGRELDVDTAAERAAAYLHDA